jgi:hypothetical protein
MSLSDLFTFASLFEEEVNKEPSKKRNIKKKKLHGLSPRANYTDRPTAVFSVF